MEIKSVRQIIDAKISDIPDGEYRARWGGYIAIATINGKQYEFHTVLGVKGMNIPSIIFVRGGVAVIEATLDEE